MDKLQRSFFNKKIIIRGALKDKSWIGWTDGLSVITGTIIPYYILNGENTLAISYADVFYELNRAYKKYDARNEVALVKTPIAAAIINSEGLALDYTRLDYYELFHEFGLEKTHTLQYTDDECLRVYDIYNNFVGFFGIYNHNTWMDMLGIKISYKQVIDGLKFEGVEEENV